VLTVEDEPSAHRAAPPSPACAAVSRSRALPARLLSITGRTRSLKQAAPLRPLPYGVADPDHFRVQRRDRARGVIHEYRLVA
jgi:hypothetical protein